MIRLILLFCFISSHLIAGTFRDDFAVVFIDAATEAKLGAFPLDLSFLAQAISRAQALQAKGVVLKFFLDQGKNETTDHVLADSFANLPVLLQARIDNSEAKPNPLPAQFSSRTFTNHNEISGTSGWIPLPIFTKDAKDVGFVDFSTTHVPLLETYQSRTVKSLILCSIELASGKPAVPNHGTIKCGPREIKVDETNHAEVQLPAKDDLTYIPFHDFLTSKTLNSQIKGKVVIIGYDGSKIQSMTTAIGPIRAHRFFVYALQSIYDQSSTPAKPN